MEVLPARVVQANAENKGAGLPSLSQSASPVFTPHFYQRLPHSLSHLLKELPVVDGTDVSFLCDISMLRFYAHCLSCCLKHSLVYKVGSREFRLIFCKSIG
jgi:hypothetical protein